MMELFKGIESHLAIIPISGNYGSSIESQGTFDLNGLRFGRYSLARTTQLYRGNSIGSAKADYRAD